MEVASVTANIAGNQMKLFIWSATEPVIKDKYAIGHSSVRKGDLWSGQLGWKVQGSSVVKRWEPIIKHMLVSPRGLIYY